MTATPQDSTASHRRLPDFIIIGAMKSGTTSLFKYLTIHPELSACRRKEPSFFTHKHWDKGLEWYQSLFTDDANLKFEASTNYTKYPIFNGVPDRMHGILPDVKLIYIVRHPLDRIVSQLHHLMVGRHIKENVPLYDVSFWSTRGKKNIDLSMYHMQLAEYLKYYSLSQICVIKFEDLITNPPDTLNTVLEFIGVDDRFYDENIEYERHNKLSTHAKVRFKTLHHKLHGAAMRKVIPSLHRLLERPVRRPELTPEVGSWIWNQVRDDLAQFEALIGRTLDYHPPT